MYMFAEDINKNVVISKTPSSSTKSWNLN